MTQTPTPSEPEPEPLAALHARNALYFADVLIELAAMGAEIAALYDKPGQDQPNASHRILRRSVRETLLLAQKFTDAGPTPRAAQLEQERAASRNLVMRKVEDAIAREAPPGEADKLRAELAERLNGPEFQGDIGQRPVAEIIEELCRDLWVAGKAAQRLYKRRTPADITLLSARAAAPCRPRRPGRA